MSRQIGGELKIDPAAGAQVWQIADGTVLEVAVPVITSSPTASGTLYGDPRIWDGFEQTTAQPWQLEVLPTVSYPVASTSTSTTTTSSSSSHTTSTTHTTTTATTTATSTQTSSTSTSVSTTTSHTSVSTNTTQTFTRPSFSITLTLTSISLPCRLLICQPCVLTVCHTVTTTTTTTSSAASTSTSSGGGSSLSPTTTTTTTSSTPTASSPSGGGGSSGGSGGSGGPAAVGPGIGVSGVGGAQFLVPAVRPAAFTGLRCPTPQHGKAISCAVTIAAAGAKLSLTAYGAPVTGSTARKGKRKTVIPVQIGALTQTSTGAAGPHRLTLTLTHAGAALLAADKKLAVTLSTSLSPCPGAASPSTGSASITLRAPAHHRRRG